MAGHRAGPADTGTGGPGPGGICDWCAHKALCPAFGGTPPDLPADEALPSAASGELAPGAGLVGDDLV